MHVLSTFNIIREKLVLNNFLCKYFIKQLNPLYQPAWTILVKLGEINMTPLSLIILNKTQSFITG